MRRDNIDTPPPHIEAMNFINCIFVLRPFSFVCRAQGGRQGIGKEEKNEKRKKEKKGEE